VDVGEAQAAIIRGLRYAGQKSGVG
jgi:hypothetical protein